MKKETLYMQHETTSNRPHRHRKANRITLFSSTKQFLNSLGEESELTAEELKDLTVGFCSLDTNNDGLISTLDLQKLMLSLGQCQCTDKKVMLELIQDVIPEVSEIDLKPQIDFTAYVSFLARRIYKTSNVYDDLIEAFKIFDYDSDGFISVDDLYKSLQGYGEELSREEIEEMIRLINPSYFLNLDDFLFAVTASKK